jgi:hypothetical protein
MGLENKTLEGNRPNISNTFTRSLITLISLPLFGLPIIGEFQTKISGIKVYKRKCPY